jgi:membrane-anchored glycerophosphoryl diester phosphodiesterase (GDPDase)
MLAGNMTPEDRDFGVYAKSRIDLNQWKSFLSFNNIVIAAIFVLITILSGFYLGCLTESAVLHAIKGHGRHGIFKTANAFFARLLGVRIMMMLIVMLPFALLALICALLFMVHPLLGGFFGFLAFFAFLAFAFIVAVRLFFVVPILFLENRGAIESIRHAYEKTKGRFVKTLVVFAIFMVINYGIGSFINQPLYSSFFAAFTASNSVLSVFYFLIGLVLTCVGAVLMTFQTIFLFNAYIESSKSPSK